jgi:uncharacterized protein
VSTNDPAPLSTAEAAVDIAAIVALVLLSAVGAGILVAFLSPEAPNLALAVLVQALLSIAAVRILLNWRDQRWSDIGLQRPRASDLPRALLVLGAGFAVNALLTAGIVAVSPQTLQQHLSGLEQIAGGLTTDTPLAAALALLLIGGFYEEIVSRGLLLVRSRRLLGGFWLPVLFSSVLFALGHFYQGLYGVVQTALFGMVLAVFTLRWGTLWPAIFAHAAINMLSVVQLANLQA